MPSPSIIVHFSIFQIQMNHSSITSQHVTTMIMSIFVYPGYYARFYCLVSQPFSEALAAAFICSMNSDLQQLSVLTRDRIWLECSAIFCFLLLSLYAVNVMSYKPQPSVGNDGDST